MVVEWRWGLLESAYGCKMGDAFDKNKWCVVDKC